ncbi:MAG: rhomboid family intramembrane serine protease [Verrucomicrobiota bacterium]|nr:rhomboid family intramembrane serine protease [Verrucomicrobiota bacterium]
MTTEIRCDNLVPMRLGRKSSSFIRPWTQHQRVVLVALIGINVGAFVLQLILDSYQAGFVQDYLGLSESGVQSAYAWQFFTAMFLHSGPWHFAANIAILYLLGRDVESILGQRHFLFLYLAGALAGELSHLFLMPHDSVLFGASGGVAAILMAYATILPELELSAPMLLHVKAKYLGYVALSFGLVLLVIDRGPVMLHSAIAGGCMAGWVYAHLLGFGRPSFLQCALHQRKMNAERHRHMNAEQFIAEEVDPLLEKISRTGLQSLTRKERRTLTQAREKLAEKS